MWWVALIMIPLALLQVPSLVNRKQWGELAGYSLVWLMAATYALLVAARSSQPVEVLRTRCCRRSTASSAWKYKYKFKQGRLLT